MPTRFKEPPETGTRGPAWLGRVNKWSWIFLIAIVVALGLGRWTLLVAILGLALLILVHEFGHFIAAKGFGMRVEKFYVGFPPAAARRRRGETEYGIGLVPLGGFCKITGMSPEEPVSDALVDELLAAVRAGSIDSTYTVAELEEALKRVRARVNKRIASTGALDDPDITEWRRQQALLEERLAELQQPEGRGDPVYWKKPVWQRNITIFAGPFMNFVAAGVILFAFILIEGTASPSLTLDRVVEGTPAAAIGLVAGDTLVSGDGVVFEEWADAQVFLQESANKEVTLVWLPAGASEGATRSATVTLEEHPDVPGSGYLGVRAGIDTDRPPPWEAAWLAVTGTYDVFRGTFQGFYMLFSGEISATGDEGAVGPVGIIDVSQDAVREGYYPILLAFLSVNLGIINLLPLLPFDGGHILFNTVEKLKGRRIDAKVLERFAAVGVTLLILLFLFLTFSDLNRIFG
ncbi:MAG TPA: M50 family metallopeptidase [Thermoleophilia bacterium]|nr:M50 family metallopeptidase [Thermoleophilia bacterium]